MFDQTYKREDLGFSFITSTLGEIVTDPGLKPGQWFVKHSDADGLFVIDLEQELSHFAGNDQLWNLMAKAVFNHTENVIMIFKLGTIETERHMMTLLHRSAAQAYITVGDM